MSHPKHINVRLTAEINAEINDLVELMPDVANRTAAIHRAITETHQKYLILRQHGAEVSRPAKRYADRLLELQKSMS